MDYPHERLDKAIYSFEYLHPSDQFMQLASIGWDDVSGREYRYPRNRRGPHARAVLQITLSGEGRIQDSRGVHALTKHMGMLCIMPGESTYFLDRSVCDGWEFLFVAIRGNDALTHWLRLIDRFGSVIDFNRYPEPLRIVSSLYADVAEHGSSDEYRYSAKLYELMLSLYRCGQAPSVSDLHAPEPIRKAISYVQSNYAQPFALAELADCAGYTVEHFIRKFTRWTGLSPMQYVKKTRVEKAANLLANSSKTLDLIAEETGFGDKSHLIKSFRTLMGVTPGQYRKENTMSGTQIVHIRK